MCVGGTTCIYFMGAIDFALKNQLIPVIDLKECYMPLMQDLKFKNKENAWHYYFEDIVPGYDLNELLHSRNVIFCDRFEWCDVYAKWAKNIPLEAEKFEQFHNIVKQCLILKLQIEHEINLLYEQIFPRNERISGVNIRAEYRRLSQVRNSIIKGHPRQYGLQALIEAICQKMELWNCRYIFVASDCAYYLEEIKKYFGDKCLCMNRKRRIFFSNGNSVLEESEINREIDKISMKQLTTEYIEEVYLLSKCTCLMGVNPAVVSWDI